MRGSRTPSVSASERRARIEQRLPASLDRRAALDILEPQQVGEAGMRERPLERTAAVRGQRAASVSKPA